MRPIPAAPSAARRSRPGAALWRLAPLCLLLCLLSRAALALGAPAIPPPPERRVTDEVGVLSAQVRASLERRLAAYEAENGHQIIVWIDRSSGDLPLDTFAVEAFEAWKLGQAKLDDGVGVFVMVEDRKIRIEVGYGLEPVLTDLAASRVIRETMIPAVERGEWDQAIVGGVEALVDTIEGKAGALPPDPGTGDDAGGAPQPEWVRVAKIVGAVIVGLVLLILFITNPRLALMLLFFVGRGGGGGGGGGFRGGGGRSGGGGAGGGW